MVRENLAQMRADIQLPIHLRSVEADEIAIRSEKERIIARISLVPCFKKQAIELACLAL